MEYKPQEDTNQGRPVPPVVKPSVAAQDGEDQTDYSPSHYSVIEKIDEKTPKKLGTFGGVFRPTILTIFGVIMYIRMGWIVGNAGLLGALLILFMTFTITGTAALAFSSITTNIRLKAGGVFALVSQSLGLEAGGALGIPLYLAQSLGAALYIYGFAEGWSFLFPDHPTSLVIMGIFAVGFLLSVISEKLALSSQVLVMAGVVMALVSMFGGFWAHPDKLHQPILWGKYEDASLWILFAVFFPSGTGIKVGASLSGKLEDPRRSIPFGTLSAWAVALVTYTLVLIWYSMVATPEELRGDYLIAIERSAWGPAVLIGLLSSCASAMLSSMVAAPNVLAALGAHGIIPGGKFLAKESKGGTPRNAVMVNALMVASALLLGDLNRVAIMITMFFLITYATLNIVVLIEQSLGLLSFRPTFRIPIWIPILGTVTSVFAMVITNPFFGLMALCLVVAIYAYLETRRLETPWETVRSGIFIALADWAARKSQKVTGANERAWKPDLLIPFMDRDELQGVYRLLISLTKPKGSIQALRIVTPDQDPPTDRVEELIQYFQQEGLVASRSMIEAGSLAKGASQGISILAGSFFKPNVLFINTLGKNKATVTEVIKVAKAKEMGACVLYLHESALLGRERSINIWIRDQSPNWTLGLRLANLDLAILLGYQLCRNWEGQITLISAVRSEAHLESVRLFLTTLARDARLPQNTQIYAQQGDFPQVLREAPRADLNIFGLATETNLEAMSKLSHATRASCLFVLDSGNVSAIA